MFKRDEILEELLEHRFYATDTRHACFAWNIKVYTVDTSGKREGFTPDRMYNDRWNEFVQSDASLFKVACEEALHTFLTDDYTLNGQENLGVAKFSVAGRSGGWLLLRSHEKLGSLAYAGHRDFIRAIDAMSDSDLQVLIDLVKQIDVQLKAPGNAVSHVFASIRQLKEDEWQEETELSRHP